MARDAPLRRRGPGPPHPEIGRAPPRPLFRPPGGAARCDSWLYNRPKWLFPPFYCTGLWFRAARPVGDAPSIPPAYLRNEQSEAGAVIDFRDWQVPLGRRFRALKPWLVMRHYGAEGLARHIREHVRLGRVLADRVLAHPGFDLAAPPALDLVVLRLSGDHADARTTALLEAVKIGRANVRPPGTNAHI